jgi:hypothetical protein
VSRTVLTEEFVDAFDDAVNLTDFPPTFETLIPRSGVRE